MTRAFVALCVVLGLAACGADGEPTAPEPRPTASTGISITGTVEAGIVGSR
jgi:hypothetical protein